MEDFSLVEQDWLSEFDIKIDHTIDNPPVEYVHRKDGSKIKRFILNAFVNGTEVKYHATEEAFWFMINNNFEDFFMKTKYYLHVKIRRKKIMDKYYVKPEYTKIIR